jgi:hypothetical protein
VLLQLSDMATYRQRMTPDSGLRYEFNAYFIKRTSFHFSVFFTLSVHCAENFWPINKNLAHRS